MCQVCDIEIDCSEIFHHAQDYRVQTLSNGKCSTNSSTFYQIDVRRYTHDITLTVWA